MASDTADPFVFANLHLFLNQKHNHHNHHHHHNQHSSHLLHARISKLFPASVPHSTGPGVSNSRRHHNRRSSGGKITKSKSRSKASLQYLKPGALAQLRDAQRVARVPTSTPCCTRKKRHSEEDIEYASSTIRDAASDTEAQIPPSLPDMTPTPVVRVFGPLCPQRKKLLAPKAPFVDHSTAAPVTSSLNSVDVASSSPASQSGEESLLESLPLELLVRIVCNLRHDQLKPAFHVSRRLRQAVVIARQCHFDYTTPDRDRHGFVQITPPRVNRVCEIGPCRPPTPRAPRHTQRPAQTRIPVADMQQLAVPLFQETAARVDQIRQPPASRTSFRGLASHRVLFYEEELCQAVAQNSI